MTVPLDPAGDPDRPPRPRHRPAAGRLGRSSTGSSRSSIRPRRRCCIELPEYELFGIDGALIIISVAIAALGIGIGIWLFGFFRARGPARDRPTTDRPQRRDPLPVRRVVPQVVVRRPQPPRLLPLRRGRRERRHVVRRARHRRHRQRHRHRRPGARRRRPPASRPAASRTTRWASRSGLIASALLFIWLAR